MVLSPPPALKNDKSYVICKKMDATDNLINWIKAMSERQMYVFYCLWFLKFM